MDAATGPPTRYAGAPAAILLLVALALAGAVTLVGIAPGAPTTGADGEEEPVLGAGAQVIGWHYRQGGGATGLGYDVREPFLAALRTLGGPDVAGYPISAPFLAGDGCLYQLFQILPLQACPDRPAEPANTFQLLEAQGADEALLALGIGPGEREDSVGAAAAVERRLNWLEDEAIREGYLAYCGREDTGVAVQRCGVPMNRPQQFGPFVSQRFQRIAFQRWLEDGPGGVRAGEVTPVLGGELLKQMGAVEGPATLPHPLGQPPAIDDGRFVLIASASGESARQDVAGVSVTGTGLAAAFGAAPASSFSERATLGVLGTVVDVAAGQTGFAAARDGQDVVSGDTVRTDATGSALVTYYQGTSSEVGPASVLVVQRLAASERGEPQVSLFQGIGQVVHRIGTALTPGAIYEVRTPSAVAVVRGTVFRVTVEEDGTTAVELFRGHAEVTAQGLTVNVLPGTESRVAPGKPPSPPGRNNTSAPSDDAPGSRAANAKSGQNSQESQGSQANRANGNENEPASQAATAQARQDARAGSEVQPTATPRPGTATPTPSPPRTSTPTPKGGGNSDSAKATDTPSTGTTGSTGSTASSGTSGTGSSGGSGSSGTQSGSTGNTSGGSGGNNGNGRRN